MNENQDVIQQLRDHLHRQVRTADQIKAELADAFSAAAEVLLQQQASELVTAADQLRRQTGVLEGLLTAMPQTDANVRELLRRTQDLNQRTGMMAERLESLVANLEGSLNHMVDQRLGDLSAALATMQSDFADRIGETRADLARHAQTLGEDQEARVEGLLTTTRAFLKQADEMVRRVEGKLATAEQAGVEVALRSTERIETAITGVHQEFHRQIDEVAGMVESRAADFAQRQDRIARENEERVTTLYREFEAIRKEDLAGIREVCQQISKQGVQLQSSLESFAKTTKERLDLFSKLLERGFTQSTTAVSQLQSDAEKRQAEDTALLKSWVQQVEQRLNQIEKGNEQRIATLQLWLISGGALLILIILLQLFYKQ